jgi:dTDP-4-dehydrorhamnose reductase
MPKTLIVGVNGQLGRELHNLLRDSIAVSRDALDITNENATLEYIKANQPSSIVNCAAYTNVDFAENAGKEAAYAVNESGARNLANAAKVLDIPFIHISTDFVFNGDRSTPYSEDNETSPINVYGKSKLAGEIAALKAHKKQS